MNAGPSTFAAASTTGLCSRVDTEGSFANKPNQTSKCVIARKHVTGAAKVPADANKSSERESESISARRNLPLSSGKVGTPPLSRLSSTHIRLATAAAAQLASQSSKRELSRRSAGRSTTYSWSSSQRAAFAAQLSQLRAEPAEQTSLGRLRKRPRGRRRLRFVRPCVTSG